MAVIGVRREKAALSSGCKAHPAIRSSRKQPGQAWSCWSAMTGTFSIAHVGVVWRQVALEKERFVDIRLGRDIRVVAARHRQEIGRAHV